MCGITGLAFYNKERKIFPEVLRNMTDSLEHRGPDDNGYYFQDSIGLGFRRLSIIDLNCGHQPISNFDNSIVIVFNGEIYNYLEQRHFLEQKGYFFKTTTDTEVILHLYEEYGISCLQYLRGMFAFAIWDDKRKHLFCARDRFGIKPFYYYTDEEKFVFGSEIKSILKCPNIDKSISYDGLDSYLAFGYITSNLSIFENISKLEPGHFLLLSLQNKSIKISKYWEINFNPDYSKDEKSWTEEIQNCLSEVIKLHMIADVPLGAFLSGGIDSSSVVAMMATNSNRSIKTFSIGFKEQKFDELKYAREIATKYGCQHHEEILEPKSINLLSKLVASYDEPFADSSAIPTYLVSNLARKYVKVALSGDGGDELFAGYKSYSRFSKLYSNPLNFKSPHLNKIIWGNINRLIPDSVKGKGLSYLLSQDRNYQFAYQQLWIRRKRRKLMIKDFQSVNGSENYKLDILKNCPIKDHMSQMQYLDLKTYMTDCILTKVDRASMQNSLEVRVPLLDHKFAELTFKIPWNLKFNESEQKYIFKKAMAPMLPESILKHRKQGFAIPLSIWFKEDLKIYINDTFNSADCLLYDYLNKKFIKEKILTNQIGSRDYSEKIWALLFLDEWLKQNR